MARPRFEPLARPLAARRARTLRALTLAVAALSPWVSGGCRAVDNAQVDVLERELRQQEDYIYELEDYLIEYSEKLRECRTCPPTAATVPSARPRAGVREPTLADDRPRTPAAPRGGSRRPIPPIEEPAPEAEPLVEPPTDDFPAEPPAAREAEPFDPGKLEAPDLEIGPSADFGAYDASPIATTPAGDEAPPFIPDPADYQIDVEPAPAPKSDQTVEFEAAVDESVAAAAGPELTPPALEPPAGVPADRLQAQRLTIRQMFGEPPSEDGSTPASLLVVIEAVNATDEPVDANGEISLMIMAGETQETLQRIERWDFTAEETRAAWQSSHLGDGLHLQLPLTSLPLPTGPLQLFARLVDADGQKLLARADFNVAELISLDAYDPKASEPTMSAGAITPAAAVARIDEAAAPAAGEEPPAVQAAASAPSSATPKPLPSSPATKWRTSSEAPLSAPVAGSAATPKGGSAGWTRQPPGGRAPFATPRTAQSNEVRDWQPFR